MMYTFDEQTLSDLHKDARGFRPRSESFWNVWKEASDAGKQSIWDGLIDELTTSMEEEKKCEERAVVTFLAELKIFIDAGAKDRETALRWMASDETFYSTQCVEGWVFNLGILFTDYGRNLVKELAEIVTFEDVTA